MLKLIMEAICIQHHVFSREANVCIRLLIQQYLFCAAALAVFKLFHPAMLGHVHESSWNTCILCALWYYDKLELTNHSTCYLGNNYK